jgi:hypothetical protein
MRNQFLRTIGALATLLMASGASSAVIVTAVQTGSDVVFSASGTLDLSGLTFDRNSTTPRALIHPNADFFVLGPATTESVDLYTGVTTIPDLGSADFTYATSGMGDAFGPDGDGLLGVPAGFISGDSITSSSTYSGQTLASLGIASGSYVWSWSSDSITLNVQAIPVPAAVWLFGSALGLLGWIRHKNV